MEKEVVEQEVVANDAQVQHLERAFASGEVGTSVRNLVLVCSHGDTTITEVNATISAIFKILQDSFQAHNGK